jgi:hypothetical protein
MRDIVATIISAVAASTAAVLAAANLFVSGRREHAKWARDALVEVLITFLDASFQSKDAVKHALREAQIDPSSTRVAELLEEAQDAERRMRLMQTRLRLLAPPSVVDAAQELRTATLRYARQFNIRNENATSTDLETRRQLWALRQHVLDEAKDALSLPKKWRRQPNTKPTEAF